jgi:hypothetical protein
VQHCRSNHCCHAWLSPTFDASEFNIFLIYSAFNCPISVHQNLSVFGSPRDNSARKSPYILNSSPEFQIRDLQLCHNLLDLDLLSYAHVFILLSDSLGFARLVLGITLLPSITSSFAIEQSNSVEFNTHISASARNRAFCIQQSNPNQANCIGLASTSSSGFVEFEFAMEPIQLPPR